MLINFNDITSVKTRKDITSLLDKMNAKLVCEIGVRDGENFSNLLSKFVKEAIAIDCWQETGVISQNDDRCSFQESNRQYQKMLDWSKKDNRIKVIKDFSINASKMFPDEYFDFIYIDADHTEDAVYADLNAWYPKVRTGGILAGHDYCEFTLNCGVKFGVIQAVNKFVNENELKLHVDDEPLWHDWFILKK